MSSIQGLDRVLIEMVDNLNIADAAKASAVTMAGHVIFPKEMQFSEMAKNRMNLEAKKILKKMNLPRLV